MALALMASEASGGGTDGFGVGVIVGDPTGLSLKTATGESSAFDAAAAWSLGEGEDLHLHVDYLRHHFGVVELDPGDGSLPLYYGIGGRLVLRDEGGDGPPDEDDAGDPGLGARVPLGAAYLFEEAPVELFGEVVPVLELAPDTDLDMDAALGARVYL